MFRNSPVQPVQVIDLLVETTPLVEAVNVNDEFAAPGRFPIVIEVPEVLKVCVEPVAETNE